MMIRRLVVLSIVVIFIITLSSCPGIRYMQISKIKGYYWESEEPYLYLNLVDWYGEIEEDGQIQVIDTVLTPAGTIEIYLFDLRQSFNSKRENYLLTVDWSLKNDKLILSDEDSERQWKLVKVEEKFIPTPSPS